MKRVLKSNIHTVFCVNKNNKSVSLSWKCLQTTCPLCLYPRWKINTVLRVHDNCVWHVKFDLITTRIMIHYYYYYLSYCCNIQMSPNQPARCLNRAQLPRTICCLWLRVNMRHSSHRNARSGRHTLTCDTELRWVRCGGNRRSLQRTVEADLSRVGTLEHLSCL